MTATSTATPVRFTQRPDHSLVLGLSATRAITLAACLLAVAIVTVTSGMTTGLIAALGISPVAGAALLMVEGRALIEWAPDAARYLWRGASGRLRFLAKPDRPAPAGMLPIPGTAQQLSVFEAVGGSAILRDAAADTWTAVAAVTGSGFLYADAETQDAAAAGFGRALAAVGSDGRIQRIHVIHRTRPDTKRMSVPVPDHGAVAPSSAVADRPDSRDALLGGGISAGGVATVYREKEGAVTAVDTAPTGNSKARPASAAAAAYREALGQYRAAWSHDTLIAITLGGKTARAAIRKAGRGRTAAARILAAHQAGLAETLGSADVNLEKWLTPADLADWIDDGFDPNSIRFHHRPTTATPSNPGDPADSAGPPGPMAVAETWSTIRTDSAWHQVLWVSGWPRFDTHPAFLAPMILPAGATVTISLVYEPIPTAVALRQIGRDKTAQASDAALRRRIGTLDTVEQQAREADTVRRETEIAEGHLDMRHTALIAITSATRGDLTDATTRVRQGAAAAGCETRILYGQQLAALNATILPAGIRL